MAAEETISLYVRHLADHMALRDWQFRVEFDDRLRDSLANIECVQNRRFAVLCIGPDFLGASDEDQRYGIVHELIHCHLAPVQTMFGTLSAVHGATHATLQQNHDNHIESATDALARSLAFAMPTPADFRKGQVSPSRPVKRR